MYNDTEYIKLIEKVSKKMKNIKITLSIYHAPNKITYPIVKNSKNKLDVYHIVFDPLRKLSVMNYPESYYCNTIEELKEILFFILKHKSIYVSKIKSDVMDLDDLLSLDQAGIEY